MAVDKQVLVIEIQGVQREINSVKDLKKALADAKSELLKFEAGTEGFAKAQKNISLLKDKMDGLGDSTRIQGTGVERLSQSFGLLTESLGSGDLDKAKVAFTGIGQAMAAIPIFLLLEGLKLIYDNFDKIVDIGKSFLGIVNENQKAIKQLSKEIENNKGQTDLLKASIEGEIAIMIAQGKGIDSILAKRKELSEFEIKQIEQSIKLNRLRLEELKKETDSFANTAINGVLAALGFQDKAMSRAIESAGERLTKQKEVESKILSSEAEITKIKTALIVEETNARNEAYKKRLANEEALANQEFKNLELKEEQRAAESKRELEERLNFDKAIYEQDVKDNERAVQSKVELNARLKAEQDLFNLAILQGDYKLAEDKLKAEEDLQARLKVLEKQELERKKAQEAAKVQATTNSINAANNFSKAYFNNELNRAKGNEEEQAKIKKKMFEVDKAFNIARAIQDGIRSVQAALTIPPPGGQILAASNAILAAANIAAIKSTTFDGGGPVSTPTMPSANAPTSVPELPTQQVNNNTFQTYIPQQNQPQQGLMRAYMVESDVSEMLRDVKRVEAQSKI